MPKIKMKYLLKTSSSIINKEITGIKKDNTIIFKDDEFITNIKVVDNDITIVRENNYAILTISFKNINNCIYHLKEYNNDTSIDIKLNEKIITRSSIYVNYAINDDNIEFLLEYEVMS